MPIMLTKVEIEAQKAKRKMLKDIQDKCIHADIDQVMTKAGWRCMVCGKIIEDTPRPDSPKPGSI